MKVGLIDVDGHHFPNIPLMKLSAWHKAHGDTVEWYEPLFSGYLDRVYASKVFSFTMDYPYHIQADEVVKGGTGYCIETVNGVEQYRKEKDMRLPDEIEHTCPDYSLYPELCSDTAYGFLTRGCPRECKFCHVGAKEGTCSVKVSELSEFWHGQKKIVLCDPNLIACREWKPLMQQLIDSKAKVNLNQGVDIRLMTPEKAQMIKQLRIDSIHFAWDRYEDKEKILPKFEMCKEITGWGVQKDGVFVLTNFDTTIEQDLDRIYTLRDMGYNPYVMIYNKEATGKNDLVRKMQRWVNNRRIFNTVKNFAEYQS